MRYEYWCGKCRLITEVVCKIADTTPAIKCPQCGKKASKNLSMQLGDAVGAIPYFADFFTLRNGQVGNVWHIPPEKRNVNPRDIKKGKS